MDPLIRSTYLTQAELSKIYRDHGSDESLQAAFCPSFGAEYLPPNTIDECRADPADLASGSPDEETITHADWDDYMTPKELVRRVAAVADGRKPCFDKRGLLEHVVHQIFSGISPSDPADNANICRTPERTAIDGQNYYAAHGDDISRNVIVEKIREARRPRVVHAMDIFHAFCDAIQHSCCDTQPLLTTYQLVRGNAAQMDALRRNASGRFARIDHQISEFRLKGDALRRVIDELDNGEVRTRFQTIVRQTEDAILNYTRIKHVILYDALFVE
jgi:hypothetical protein